MMDDDWTPARTLGTFTRRSGDVTLLESYIDAYEVNGTGAFIWAQVGRGATLADITKIVAEHYQLEPGYVADMVRAFLAELVDRGFIAPPEGHSDQ